MPACQIFAVVVLLASEPLEASPQDLYEKAELARKERRDEDALAFYRKALAGRPDYLEAHLGYQKLLQSQGRESELISEYAKLLESEGASWCCYLYARLLHDPVREEALYRRALEGSPATARYLCGLGEALLDQRRIDEALSAYRKAIAAEPDWLTAHRRYVAAMHEAGRDEALAEEYGKRCDDARGENITLVLACAGALSVAGRYEAARRHLDRALELAPHECDVLYTQGIFFVKRRSIPDARSSLEAALRIDPYSHRTLSALGKVLLLVGEYDKGYSLLKEAARLEPGSSSHASDLGAAATLQGRPRSARAHLQEALRLKPANYRAMVRLADLAFQAHQVDQAVEWLEKAVAINPNHAEGYLKLGEAYRSMGEHERARAALQRGNDLQIAGDFVISGIAEKKVIDPATVKASALSLLGKALLREGKVVEARAKFEAALVEDPNLLQPYYGLGRIAQRLGDPAKALGHYRRLHEIAAREGDERVGIASVRIADCLYTLGRKGTAARAYREALEEHGAKIAREEALESIVRNLQQRDSAAELVRLEGVAIGICAEDDYCAPQTLHAVLTHWGVPSDIEQLGDELVGEKGPTAKEILAFLDRTEGVAGLCFTADPDIVRELLRRGFPLILLHRIVTPDGYRGHASVVVGHDGARGVALIEDPNWYWGNDRIAFERLQGRRVVLAAPADRLRAVADSLPGQRFCALLNEGERVLGRGGGDPAEAEKLLQEAAELEPSSYLARLYLGILAQDRGQVEVAARHFEQAASLPGGDAEAWFRWGAILMVQGRLDEAQRTVRRGLEIESRLVDLHGLLADVCFRKGNFDEAIQAARRLVRLFPSHGKGRMLLGELLAGKGATEDAIGELRLSILYGGPPFAHFILGTLFAQKGERVLAIEELEKFCELEPDPMKKARAQVLLEKVKSEARAR